MELQVKSCFLPCPANHGPPGAQGKHMVLPSHTDPRKRAAGNGDSPASRYPPSSWYPCYRGSRRWESHRGHRAFERLIIIRNIKYTHTLFDWGLLTGRLFSLFTAWFVGSGLGRMCMFGGKVSWHFGGKVRSLKYKIKLNRILSAVFDIRYLTVALFFLKQTVRQSGSSWTSNQKKSSDEWMKGCFFGWTACVQGLNKIIYNNIKIGKRRREEVVAVFVVVVDSSFVFASAGRCHGAGARRIGIPRFFQLLASFNLPL